MPPEQQGLDGQRWDKLLAKDVSQTSQTPRGKTHCKLSFTQPKLVSEQKASEWMGNRPSCQVHGARATTVNEGLVQGLCSDRRCCIHSKWD